ncbi:hypothetical protein [Noviherbaspirillum aridicola]|uniref:SMODS and SLOG-associating 2TM effector domain-containing protein n=1 Tax=Noviherbaspirillum aridicola TaxID=2849687 RepID=A0ABQ4Q151_9BURK|nr:hypothetical protein [Noviherbaspirillum aridicola]GIZ50911.1 hypothetical protein NCCP691_09250 [Noviherbaspirillum aridicola]
MRARFMQLLRQHRFDPALRVAGEWPEAAAEIGRLWQAQIERFRPANADRDALDRLLALEAERKSLPHDPVRSHALRMVGRSEPAGAGDGHARTRHEVCEQEIETFFDALRFTPSERARIRQGFETMGTGGMHRALPVLLTSVVIGLGGGALMADGGTLKAGLHIARMSVQLALGAAIFYAGRDRFRTSALEDVLTHGRADSAPRLKQAPHLMRASWDAMRRIPGMRSALGALESAIGRLDDGGEAPDPAAVADLRRCFARVCHLMSVADGYKRAADNAAGEFQGNERTLTVSWGTSLMYLIGMGLSILTPMKIDAAGVGGAMTASAALGLLAFLAAQVAGGADADGLEKGQRAIVNLVRHVVGDVAHDRVLDDWARAYADYLAADGGRQAPSRKAALQRLDETLAGLDAGQGSERGEDEPGAGDTPPSAGTGRSFPQPAPAPAPAGDGNTAGDAELEALLRFTLFASERLDTGARPASPPPGPDPAPRPATSADAAGTDGGRTKESDPLQRALADILLQSWKTPLGLRLEAMDRLLTGEVARTHDRLLRTATDLGPRNLFGLRGGRKRADALRDALKGDLADLHHLECARREMRADDGGSPARDAADRAAAHLAHIRNRHVRDLFTGDTRAQLAAMRKSRRLTAGETLRYTVTNFGSNVLPVVVTTGLGAGDLSVTLQRVAGTYAGPQYLDFKMGALASTGVQPGAYISAGARAAFQKRDMDTVREALRPAQPETVRAPKPEDGEQQAWLDELVARLEQRKRVPEVLAFPAPGEDDMAVPLAGTAGHLSSLYRGASGKQKRAAKMAYMKMGLTQAGVGTVAVMMQPFAARRMEQSRDARQSAPALLDRAREAMARRRPAMAGDDVADGGRGQA